ncbi:MAG: HEPN domain-containing protein [bacterium]|jgi:hypothetical protein|nr:HEPN domain-containing protein [candidate division KSB1 bacterium]MDH7559858.1 HEPN domain-containing protein [bacterium]
MSVSKNRYEAERWLRTAEEDLQAAETLLAAGWFAQACFWGESTSPGSGAIGGKAALEGESDHSGITVSVYEPKL